MGKQPRLGFWGMNSLILGKGAAAYEIQNENKNDN